MQIKFDAIKGIPELQAFLKEIPRGGIPAAVRAFGEYLLGNDSHGLRHMVPWKYVSRKAAGYKTSAKQWAFMFATGILKSEGGKVTLAHPGERHDTTRGWYGYTSDGGYSYKLRSNKASAFYTMSDKGQARQPAKVGHQKTSAVIASNKAGAFMAAVSALNKWIRERKTK